jgi:predicted N-acetyltransferase YhbS
MTDTLSIRPAAMDDMNTIISLINQVAEWLGTKGTDQWANPWPTVAARDARVSRNIRGGSTWIAEDDGEPVATITYRETGNQKLWTAEERRTPAVYLSRLIVNRKREGDHIGEALIDWAGYRALQGWKAQCIRIDVWTTNFALHDYYEKRGFRFLRICKTTGPLIYPSAALFEKPTAEVNEAAAARFTEVAGRVPEPDEMTSIPACP